MCWESPSRIQWSRWSREAQASRSSFRLERAQLHSATRQVTPFGAPDRRLFSGVASKCMEVLPGAPGIAPLASSAIRAMGIMGHACVHRGLPLPVVGAEIRSLLSEAAARLGPSSVSGRAMGTGETQREWWWLQALMPDSGAVLACGGWCGIRRPDGLRHTAAAWWEVCRSVVTAASRGIAAFHVSGSTEAAMSSVLTVAAGLADVSGVGRSGWEAQGWGALLSEVGQTLADLGAYPLVSSLVGLLMDALAEVDTPPQKDDVAASSCALAAVVVGVVARARREAKESDRALEMLEKAVDVLSSAYVSPAMGAARRGVAMGLAHLGHGVRAHGFPDAVRAAQSGRRHRFCGVAMSGTLLCRVLFSSPPQCAGYRRSSCWRRSCCGQFKMFSGTRPSPFQGPSS